jgi:hypothetical protein
VVKFVSWAFGWYVAVLENNNFTLKALFFPPDFGEGIVFNNQFYYVRGQWQDQINTIPTYQLTDATGAILSAGDLAGTQLLQVPITTAGVHHFNANYSGVLSGNATSGQVAIQFDTTLADKNPPVLQEIQILQGTIRKEKVADGTGKIAVRAADSSPNLTVQIEMDKGAGWQNLVVTQLGDIFSADVPAFSPTVDTFVNLRLTIVDTFGNRTVNTISPGFIVLAVPIATSTATQTASPTHTATATHTATFTTTPTNTHTLTASPTATQTASPTHTATATHTATFTATPTNTHTLTASPTATQTASPTHTATPTTTPLPEFKIYLPFVMH